MGRHFSKVRGPRAYWAPQTKKSGGPGPPRFRRLCRGQDVLSALSEFYANAHLETPKHSSSSSRIDQPTGRKDVFHIGLRCSGTGQVLNKPFDVATCGERACFYGVSYTTPHAWCGLLATAEFLVSYSFITVSFYIYLVPIFNAIHSNIPDWVH